MTLDEYMQSTKSRGHIKIKNENGNVLYYSEAAEINEPFTISGLVVVGVDHERNMLGDMVDVVTVAYDD